MRILFLCSGLEPGRDGVGDYTRRLAAECVRQGHECRIVALNDQTAGEEPGCLRCSGSIPWPERMERVREFVAEFAPDWISLQFVPYGFQRKGVPWRLARDLQRVIAGRPLQLMFHELWIGSAEGTSLKHRLVGALQRTCILRLVRTLKPDVIHTSNPTYIGRLKAEGVEAALLPLFGNIPVVEESPVFPPELVAAGIGSPARADWWLGLFFGTVHPQWESQPFLGILLDAARRANRRVGLLAVGRLGAAGEEIWERLSREYGGQIVFVKFGEQPGERISGLLQIADFGIATSPWDLIGKSGSAAAMLDHGLPVIVTREEETRGYESLDDPLLYRCDGALESKLVAGLPQRAPVSRVVQIASRFLSSLRETAMKRKG
jgi:glycosyltransferase involved in cell wall biosynthesis